MALFKPFKGSRASLDAQPLHDGYAYFCTDDGSFHIDYVDAEGSLQRKQINAKDAETLMGMSLDELKAYVATQPDWNQTDATKSDYIKNRTHYTYEDTVTVFTKDIDIVSGNNIVEENTSMVLAEGEIYTVIFDNATYECEAKTYTDLTGASYDLALVGVHQYAGDYFFIHITDGNLCFFNYYTKAGTYLLEVSKTVEAVSTLDEKYIPDTIARASDLEDLAQNAYTKTEYGIATSLMYTSDKQIPTTRAVSNSLNSLQRKIVHADLATNDSSKRSYVKNRTHWIEYEKGEELVSFSFNAETSYVNGYRALSYDEDAEAAITLLKTLLVEGTMYIVVHNNIEYECVVSHGFMSDEIYLGNMWISSSAKEDTEEQFLIRPNENGYGHFVSIGAGTQSIAIYAANEIVHPLDEKFLPEAIAYTSDVDEIKTLVGDTSVSEQINTALDSHVVSWNDLNDKPFETVYAYNISSDGNEEGLLSYMGFYKVSDLVPSIEDFANGFIFKAAHDSVEQFYTKDDVSVGDMFWGASAIKFKEGPYFAVVQEDATSSNGQTTLTKGVYFMSTMGFAHTLKIGGVDIIHDECISDTIARVSDIPEQVQSDWSVNDEADPTYIKNRTHWSKISRSELLPECQLEVTTDGMFTITNDIEAVAGRTYIVNWNGTSYICIAVLLNGLVCIGNGKQLGEVDTGEPFLIGFYPRSTALQVGYYAAILPLDESTTCTISIIEQIEEIHKLDNKYLSDEILAKPDWNTAEGELGHILNRTHYTEEVLEEIIPETTVTFGDATNPGCDTGTATGSATQIYPEYGEMFAIEWNGIKYYSIARPYTKTDGSFGQGVGNTGMFGGGGYPQYPFLIGFLTEEEATTAGHTYFVWVNDGSTTATFSVSKVGEVVHRLDAKYLPENIATVDYVDTAIAATKPKMTTITLPAENWIGDTNPWSQVVTINSATATSKVDLQPTALQIVSLQDAEITLMLQNDAGVITAWAIGNKPTEDYTMQVLITEVVSV